MASPEDFSRELTQFEASSPDRHEDIVFARLLVAHQVARPDQVLECLRLQDKSVELGLVPPPRLGDLLVAHGYLASDAVERELRQEPALDSPRLPSEVADAAREPANAFGKFIRTRLLGKGGMGEVWKGWDTHLGRWVALKFFASNDALESDRFRREAQTAATLVHPNITTVYELGETGGRNFIAMQYVDGITLEDAIHRKLLGTRALTRIVRDAAYAVDFAHQHGIIHRDLKPANIMVHNLPTTAAKEVPDIDPSGPHSSVRRLRVYVMDFGLARHLALETPASTSGIVVGTPAYMPPEQAGGHLTRTDARSDVYALGATLYHGITGRLPYEAKNQMEALLKVLNEDFRPPSSILEVPPDLETIILKAMDRDPGRRYRTARELASDLQRFLDGEPISARPVSVALRLGRRLRKHPGASSAALMTIIALAVGVFFLRQTRAERAARRKAEKSVSERDLAAARHRHHQPRVDTAHQYIEQAYKLIYGSDQSPEEARRLADLALAELKPVFEEDPAYAEAWYEAGRANSILGPPDRAEADFTKAIGADPMLGLAYFERGKLHLHRYEDLQNIVDLNIVDDQARRVPRAPDSDQAANWKRLARADFAAMAKLKVTESDRLFAEGFSLVLDEKYDEAEPLFDKALASFELNADAWEYRAYCRLARGDFAGAADDLTKDLSIRPRWPRAFHLRALARLCMRDPRAALPDLDEAVRLDPGNEILYIRRAIAHRMAGDTRAALADLDHVLGMNPRRADTYQARGTVHYQRGDYKAAVNDYTKSLELDETAPAYLNRGAARFALMEYTDALHDINRSIELDPENWFAHLNLGYLRIYLNEADPAFKAFTRAIGLNPKCRESVIANLKSLRGEAAREVLKRLE